MWKKQQLNGLVIKESNAKGTTPDNDISGMCSECEGLGKKCMNLQRKSIVFSI